MKMNKNIYNIDTEDDKAYDKETKNSPPIKSKIGNKNNTDIINMLSRNRADTNGSLGIKNDSFDVDYEEKSPEKRFTPQQKQNMKANAHAYLRNQAMNGDIASYETIITMNK